MVYWSLVKYLIKSTIKRLWSNISPIIQLLNIGFKSNILDQSNQLNQSNQPNQPNQPNQSNQSNQSIKTAVNTSASPYSFVVFFGSCYNVNNLRISGQNSVMTIHLKFRNLPSGIWEDFRKFILFGVHLFP